jgi:hypothetical protein
MGVVGVAVDEIDAGRPVETVDLISVRDDRYLPAEQVDEGALAVFEHRPQRQAALGRAIIAVDGDHPNLPCDFGEGGSEQRPLLFPLIGVLRDSESRRAP